MENTQHRKSANLTLDAQLIAEAKAMKVNLSRAAEDGIRNALAKQREALWKVENQSALKSSNDFVDAFGLPLAGHRKF
jgi:antitoxin CcdA